MSTNFHWVYDLPIRTATTLPTGEEISPVWPCNDDPRIHIGKRCAIGNGRCKFIWAQDTKRVVNTLVEYQCKWPDELVAEDEYGQRYTGEELLKEIYGCEEFDMSSIGEVFC